MEITNRTDLFGRRDFLRIGSLGLGSLHLGAATTKKELSCILLWQSGGSPHIDTFDMKPSAPKDIRGEFKEISSNVPGIRVCEHLPNTAKIMDKVTVLRSMKSKENNHERAINYLLTGSVTEYGRTDAGAHGRGVGRLPGFSGGKSTFVAAANARIFDVSTGEILWADEARAEDSNVKVSVGGFGGGVDNDQRMFDKVMKPVVLELVASIKSADL